MARTAAGCLRCVAFLLAVAVKASMVDQAGNEPVEISTGEVSPSVSAMYDGSQQEDAFGPDVPSADIEVSDEEEENAGNATNTTAPPVKPAVPPSSVRVQPIDGAMSVGTSFIVQPSKKQLAAGAYTDSEANKTSGKLHFMPKGCENAEYCFQSFDEQSEDGSKECGGQPAAQDGMQPNIWMRMQIHEEGCQVNEKDTEQTCMQWDEFFLKVHGDSGDIHFKWESMSNFKKRTTIVPEIKVSKVGHCFNRCMIISHPTVLQMAEPKFSTKAYGRAAVVADFARMNGCHCCDFEVFLPDGQKCTSFELDAQSKTWQRSEKTDGTPWTDGPKCVENKHKADVHTGNIAVPIPKVVKQDEVLVDAFNVTDEKEQALNVTDEKEQATQKEKVQIIGVETTPEPEKPGVWTAPASAYKRDPLENTASPMENKESLDDELDEETEEHDDVKDTTKDPKKVKEELERVMQWTPGDDDVPSDDEAMEWRRDASMKRDLDVSTDAELSPRIRVPLPKPAKQVRKVEKYQKAGSMYTEALTKNDPSEKLASAVNDTAAEAAMKADMRWIDDTLEDEERRRDEFAEELKRDQKRHRGISGRM